MGEMKLHEENDSQSLSGSAARGSEKVFEHMTFVVRFEGRKASNKRKATEGIA